VVAGLPGRVQVGPPPVSLNRIWGWNRPIINALSMSNVGWGDMDKDWEYVSLSKRFESFAERATDPKLAVAYRSLAEQYRILDRWRQQVADRYELVVPQPDGTIAAGSTAAGTSAPATRPHPVRRRKPS
jgi:hypothetical protein